MNEEERKMNEEERKMNEEEEGWTKKKERWRGKEEKDDRRGEKMKEEKERWKQKKKKENQGSDEHGRQQHLKFRFISILTQSLQMIQKRKEKNERDIHLFDKERSKIDRLLMDEFDYCSGWSFTFALRL